MTPSTTLPSVIVTFNDLSLALDEMGLTGSVSAAELFHLLQTKHDFPTSKNLIPDIVVIHANALSTALANLNVTHVTATQLLDAIKKEESNLPDRNTLPELKSPPQFPAESTVIMKSVDREEKARRLERWHQFRKHFSGRTIADPYRVTWLERFDSTETKDLPLIPPSAESDTINRYRSSTQDTDRQVK